MSLEYKITKESLNEIEINLLGEVDIYTSPGLKDYIINLIDNRKNNIKINAENLEYIDSTGLGCLMAVYKKLNEYNLTMEIYNLKKNIYKLFDITGLNKVFDIKGNI